MTERKSKTQPKPKHAEDRLKAAIADVTEAKKRFRAGSPPRLADLMSRYHAPRDNDGETDEERARYRALREAELEALFVDREVRVRAWAHFGDDIEARLESRGSAFSPYKAVVEVFKRFEADPKRPEDWLMIMSALCDSFFTGRGRGRPAKKIPGTSAQQEYAQHVLRISAQKGIPEPLLVDVFADRLAVEQKSTTRSSHAAALRKIVKSIKASGYADATDDPPAD